MKMFAIEFTHKRPSAHAIEEREHIIEKFEISHPIRIITGGMRATHVALLHMTLRACLSFIDIRFCELSVEILTSNFVS